MSKNVWFVQFDIKDPSFSATSKLYNAKGTFIAAAVNRLIWLTISEERLLDCLVRGDFYLQGLGCVGPSVRNSQIVVAPISMAHLLRQLTLLVTFQLQKGILFLLQLVKFILDKLGNGCMLLTLERVYSMDLTADTPTKSAVV